jgi:GT2 family glycosyltransferase
MFDIVILNYKNYLDTIELLNSIFFGNVNKKLSNVYVIDNASNNESLFNIKKAMHLLGLLKEVDVGNGGKLENHEVGVINDINIHFIQSKPNGGYAAGNNIGLSFFLNKCSEYVLICNNDIFFPDNQLDIFIEEANLLGEDENIGLISNTLYYYHDGMTIQASGGYLNKCICRTTHQNSNKKTLIDTKKPDYPIGALLYFKKSTIKKVGLLSEGYFLYFEELDYCYRMKKHNLDFAVSNKSRVLHKEGASAGSSTNNYRAVSLVSDYYLNINKMVFSRKYNKRFLPNVYIVLVLNGFRRLFRFEYKKAINIFCFLVNGKMKYER